MNDVVNKVEDKIEHVAPPTSFFKRNWKWLAAGAAGLLLLVLLATCANAAEAVSTQSTFYL